MQESAPCQAMSPTSPSAFFQLSHTPLTSRLQLLAIALDSRPYLNSSPRPQAPQGNTKLLNTVGPLWLSPKASKKKSDIKPKPILILIHHFFATLN